MSASFEIVDRQEPFSQEPGSIEGYEKIVALVRDEERALSVFGLPTDQFSHLQAVQKQDWTNIGFTLKASSSIENVSHLSDADSEDVDDSEEVDEISEQLQEVADGIGVFAVLTVARPVYGSDPKLMARLRHDPAARDRILTSTPLLYATIDSNGQNKVFMETSLPENLEERPFINPFTTEGMLDMDTSLYSKSEWVDLNGLFNDMYPRAIEAIVTDESSDPNS